MESRDFVALLEPTHSATCVGNEAHQAVLQRGATIPEVWHTNTWSRRKEKGEPVLYPYGTRLSVRRVWW
jgi:hypothetical protein